MTTRLRLVAITAAAGAATVAFAARPPATIDALAAAWLVALALSAWLALSSAVALLTARRLVEVALVGSCIVGSAIPARAASRPPSHVVVRDVPVVRRPVARTPAAVTTTTTAPRTVGTEAVAPPTRAPRTAGPPATVPSPPAALPRVRSTRPTAPTPTTTIPTAHAYTVQPGDNLWTIARAALGASHDDADVVPYWHALIAANRSHLRSGDPNLIYPGEVLGLPERRTNQ